MGINSVFIIGNKRSGTSLLTKLLCYHPNVWVLPEYDIMWTLYQCQEGSTRDHFVGHPSDTAHSMWRILFRFYNQIARIEYADDRTVAIREAYDYMISAYVSGHGDVKWFGDKKPSQNADPRVVSFIKEILPDARFIHIYRHPAAVVSSMKALIEKYPLGPRWWTASRDVMFINWLTHERWALLAEPTVRIKYEELCERPVSVMNRVFEFLDLEVGDLTRAKVRAEVKESANSKYDLRIPDLQCVKELCNEYGYS